VTREKDHRERNVLLTQLHHRTKRASRSEDERMRAALRRLRTKNGEPEDEESGVSQRDAES
jgi:hypothetical protein